MRGAVAIAADFGTAGRFQSGWLAEAGALRGVAILRDYRRTRNQDQGERRGCGRE